MNVKKATVVTCHVARADILRPYPYHPFYAAANTDSVPNMSATLPRKQVLICYVVTSPVHTVTIRCYGTR
jgi:hypothetical protein